MKTCPTDFKTKAEVLEHFKILRSERYQEVLARIDKMITFRRSRYIEQYHPSLKQDTYGAVLLKRIVRERIPFYNIFYSDEIAFRYSEPFYLLEDMVDDWGKLTTSPAYIASCFFYIEEQIRYYLNSDLNKGKYSI